VQIGLFPCPAEIATRPVAAGLIHPLVNWSFIFIDHLLAPLFTTKHYRNCRARVAISSKSKEMC
jgi:hypothetical protein